MKLCTVYSTTLGALHYEEPREFKDFAAAAHNAAQNIGEGSFYFKNINGSYVAMRADKVDFVEVVTVDNLAAFILEAGEEVPESLLKYTS